MKGLRFRGLHVHHLNELPSFFLGYFFDYYLYRRVKTDFHAHPFVSFPRAPPSPPSPSTSAEQRLHSSPIGSTVTLGRRPGVRDDSSSLGWLTRCHGAVNRTSCFPVKSGAEWQRERPSDNINITISVCVYFITMSDKCLITELE